MSGIDDQDFLSSTTVITDEQASAARRFVRRALGDEAGEVLDMLGIAP